MPTFDFPPLLWWGLPLVAAPLIIHFINLLRHRRVKWAAMDFLLASQKKYRTRVMLRQFLLLLLRTLAVAGFVLALAQPRWRQALGALLGGGRSLHVVVLDDSYSMGDVADGPRLAETSAFDRGRQGVERIVAELVAARGAGEVAVGRTSRLAAATAAFDLPPRPIGPAVVQELRDAAGRWLPSAGSAGPRESLEAAAATVGGGSTAATRVLWLVSDFRVRDWRATEETAAAFRQLADAGVELRFVDCAADATAAAAGNLTIERLEVAGGVPATGVLVPFEVTVRNDSTFAVRDVQVDLREDGAVRPGVRMPVIEPGQTATQRFDVRFDRPGGHLVEARLGPDAVAADNLRTAALDIVDRVDVLLVDGDPRGGGRTGDAFYVAAALAPGAGAPTGLQPRIEPPRALASLELGQFDCIWVLDVERLDPPEIAALEAYAAAGGGVVFFLGPRTSADWITRSLHRDGAGIFPVPLAGAVDLLPDTSAARVPDLVAADHPVVAVLAGQRNPFLDAVRVERYLAVERGFQPPADAGFRQLLALRTTAPLAVERPFGAGLVVAVLSTAAPTWNNWSRGNPSWVVVLLEMESHLARPRRRAASLTVGAPITVRLEQGIDEIDVDFAVPPDGVIVRQTATATGDGPLEARLVDTATPGGYSARWRRLDGSERERIVAVNVAADEGRLERAGRERLDRALAGIPYRYEAASDLRPATDSLAGVPLAKPLLLVLLAVLLLEQAVALTASYHPLTRRTRHT